MLCLVLFAIFLAPAAAFYAGGCCQFLINMLLTCLGWIPGVIHALFLAYEYDARRVYI